MSVSVSCKACASSFRISDALYEKRFAGKTAKLRCKKCQAVIDVDGTKPAGGESSDAMEWDLEAPPKTVTAKIASAPPPKLPSAPPPEPARASLPIAAPRPRATSVAMPQTKERPASTPSLRAVTLSVEPAIDQPTRAVLEPNPPALRDASETARPRAEATVTAALPEVSKTRAPEPRQNGHDAADLTPEPVLAAPPPARRRFAPLIAASVVAVAAAAGLLLFGRSSPPEPAQVPTAAARPASISEPPEVLMPPRTARPTPTSPATPGPAASPEPSPAPEAARETPVHDEQKLHFALRWGMAQAESCHRGGRAGGTTQVAVRFAPSGRVSAVTLDNDAIANAPVGACITAYLKAMLIPPFQGPELEVVRELRLR
jgi:hypothetical protein